MTAKQTDNADTAIDIKKGTHVFLILLVSSCILFIFWATFFKLDIVSMAEGEVFPSSKIKKVEHLEGGIVQEIRVNEGEKVAKGQALIILESTQSFSDVQQLDVQIDSLRIDVARLSAELDELDSIPFTDKDRNENARLVSEAEKLFTIRKQKYANEASTAHEVVLQKEQELNEIIARLNNFEVELELALEQVAISEDLLKEDLTNRYNHIDLLKAAQTIESNIQEDEAKLKRAESALAEAQMKLAGLEHEWKEETSSKLEESRRHLDELTQKMEKYADSLERTTLIAPVDGIVKELHITSKGEVVKAGETVLDIIPAGDRLIVDARLPIKDIGYVQVGQRATIRLASQEAMRFNHLDGEVVFISPDTIIPEEGDPYYRVRIETDRDHFRRGDLRYKLFPGMQVTANIRTGRRTVMDYLLDPFMDSFSGALVER